ncbi:MAG: hypothetical protein QM501_08655, partial [Gimesia sp.]
TLDLGSSASRRAGSSPVIPIDSKALMSFGHQCFLCFYSQSKCAHPHWMTIFHFHVSQIN